MLARIMGILILGMVFAGYISFLSRKWKIRAEFGPAVVCAGISMVMFVAGIWNILRPVAVVITLAGLVLFAWYLKELFKNKRVLGVRNTVVLVVWFCVLLYFAVLIKGGVFTRYDNFSHWATVVKSMTINHRIPNFQDELIMFQAYPLGSALFIYYACTVVGATEMCFSWAQILMLVSFLLPLAAFVHKKRMLIGLIVPLYAAFALVFNVSIYELLVDTLLPLAAVALICMLASGDYLEQRGNEKILCGMLIPLNFFLVNVKNSGLFFVLVGWIAFLCFYWKRLAAEKSLRRFYLIGNVLVPLAGMFLWSRHVAYAFSGGDVSKHAMSAENYSLIFADKTAENISRIGRKMLRKMTNFQSTPNQILMIVVILLVVVAALQFMAHKNYKSPVKWLLGIGAVYGSYQFFVFCMYVFSMPTAEAMDLAGYSRYVGTILIFIYGMAVICCLKFCDYRQQWMFLLPVALCAVPVFRDREGVKELVSRQNYEETTRYQFNQLIKQEEIPAGARYIIYSNDQDGGYLTFLARYELWSSHILNCDATEFEELKSELPNYDYVIVWSQDELINGYMEENGLSGAAFQTASLNQPFTNP